MKTWLFCLCLHLDWPMQVGLSDAQDNLPGDSDAIEEVINETHVVYEGVNVTGAQHQQSGDQLDVGRRENVNQTAQRTPCRFVFVRQTGLTVNTKAGMGVQRVT